MPQYESEADRQVEASMWGMLEEALGGKLYKLPQQYGLDWMLATHDGIVLKWVELKARSHPYGTYDRYSISMSKVQRALAMEELTGKPSILVVRYLNAVYVAYFRSFLQHGEILVGGRKDRDDPQDVEPMWHLPVTQMTKLCDLETEHAAKKP